MKKTIIAGLIAGVLTLAMVMSVSISSLGTVQATSQCDNPPCDGWGQAAKDTIEATSGKEFGEHAKDPDPDKEGNETPRDGVANLAEELTGNKNPSDLGDLVSGSLP